MRASAGVFLSASAAETLYRAEPGAELEAAADAWSRASEVLAGLFRAERAEQLRRSFAGGHDVAVKALAVLDGDRGGPDEWRAYDIGRSALDGLGLGDLVDRAVRRGSLRQASRTWSNERCSAPGRISS